jgi:hypothetical protein
MQADEIKAPEIVECVAYGFVADRNKLEIYCTKHLGKLSRKKDRFQQLVDNFCKVGVQLFLIHTNKKSSNQPVLCCINIRLVSCNREGYCYLHDMDDISYKDYMTLEAISRNVPVGTITDDDSYSDKTCRIYAKIERNYGLEYRYSISDSISSMITDIKDKKEISEYD